MVYVTPVPNHKPARCDFNESDSSSTSNSSSDDSESDDARQQQKKNEKKNVAEMSEVTVTTRTSRQC